MEKQSFPLISIVVPVHNSSATLEKCIYSLSGQTYKDVEILLINNGSIDDSLELCRKFASEDNRIIVDDLSEKGVSVARNRGIELAMGTFVLFVDADDWIDANVCEFFANLNAKYNYDLFCFSAQYHKKRKTTVSYLFDNDVELFSQVQKEELQIKVFAPQAPVVSYKMNTRFAGSACGKFYKRDLLLKYNLRFAPETIISEDCLFNTLALDHFLRIGYTKKYFYHYIQCYNSAQNRYRPNSDKYFSFVIENMRVWLENTGKNQRFVDAANCLFVHYLFGILKEDIFHKENCISIAHKVRMLDMLCSDGIFAKILQNVKPQYFNFGENQLIYLLQKKRFVILSILMNLILKFF